MKNSGLFWNTFIFYDESFPSISTVGKASSIESFPFCSSFGCMWHFDIDLSENEKDRVETVHKRQKFSEIFNTTLPSVDISYGDSEFMDVDSEGELEMTGSSGGDFESFVLDELEDELTLDERRDKVDECLDKGCPPQCKPVFKIEFHQKR